MFAVLVASSWIVKFCLSQDDLTAEDRLELQRHFSMISTGDAGYGRTWEVRMPSDTAATAVQDVGLMLGQELQQRLIFISATTDIAARVRAAAPW